MKAPKIEAWDENTMLVVNTFLREVETLLNGQLMLSGNLSTEVVEKTFSATGIETAVDHGLKRVPTGFIVVKRELDVEIYSSDRQWSTDRIYLKSSTDNPVVKLLIF